MRVTILGCGTSTGVPLIGCACPICTSEEPRNKRLRCSALVEANGARVLIDTGPDLRQQALTAGIRTVDAILYTHSHADHVHGIDDTRTFNIHKRGPIPIFADRTTLWHLETRFGYCLHRHGEQDSWFRPALVPHLIDGPFEAAGVPVVPFEQRHGRGRTLGFRIGGVAYSSDVDELPAASLALLEDLDLWVVDTLRERPHPSHSHLARTLGWIERLRPRRAVLTHMSHEVDYAAWAAALPPGVVPAHDGLVLEAADP